MPIHHIQPSFAGGEFAPSLHERIDLQRYVTGLRKARNVYVHVHGGVSNRPGFRFIAKAKFPLRKCRLLRFEFSTTQAYIIEIGHLYMRFYKDGGQIVKTNPAAWVTATAYVIGDFVTDGGETYYCTTAHTSNVFSTDLANNNWTVQSAYEIPTPYTEDQIGDMRFSQSGDVLYVAHSDHTPRELSRLDHDAWTLSDYLFEGGPFMLSNITATTLKLLAPPAWATETAYLKGDVVTSGGVRYVAITNHTSGAGAFSQGTNWATPAPAASGRNYTMESSTSQFQAGHVGSLWRMIHSIADQTTRVTLTAETQFSVPLRAGATWRYFSTGTWTGRIVIERSLDNGATWQIIRQFNGNVDTFGSTGVDKCLVRVGVSPATGGTSPDDPPGWTGTAVVDFSADASEWVGIVKVTSYINGTQVKVTIASGVAFDAGDSSTANAAKAPTADWAEGSWSTVRGFPSVVAFAHDRLFWGRTLNEPQTVWASETGHYIGFTRNNPLLDTDGISIQLASQSVNAIRHFVVLGDLLAITSTEDWSIKGADGTFTPLTAQSKTQGYRGASKVAPVIIGNRVILIEPMGSVVRDMGFSFEVDGYTGDNISVLSNHLFHSHEIIDMAYAQEPDSLVWLVRDDGIMISLTYLREQEVLAWTRHDTDGRFEGVETIPGAGYDEVWVVVRRFGQRFIERLDRRMVSKEAHDQFYVDSGLSLNDFSKIIGVSKTNPVVVDAPGHGFSNDTIIEIRGVVGMAELNNRQFKVKNADTNSFALYELDAGPDSPTGPPQIILQDDFSGGYQTDVCFSDGTIFGNWTDIFGGDGCVKVIDDAGRFWLDIASQVATNSGETYASLVVSNQSFNQFPFKYNLAMKTISQLRTGSPPNNWEVAWAVWSYTDNEHFYYFIPKPEGWELGKRDPAYPGGQRFLSTGTDKNFPIGVEYNVEVSVADNNGNAEISIKVDGVHITSFVDTERPYLVGRVGCYHEDANARFTDINVTAGISQPTTPTGGAVDGTNFNDFQESDNSRVAEVFSSLSGLDHLEGKTVKVLANGIVQNDKVVTNGSITLDKAASTVHVGLAYRSEIETLNIEIPQRDGTMQGRKVKIGDVTVFVQDTLGVKIGPADGSVLDELVLRPSDEAVYGQPIALFSGQKVQGFPGGWENAGRILIVQDQPLPMTITALIPRVTTGG